MKKYQNVTRLNDTASFLEVGELQGLSLTTRCKTGAYSPVSGVKLPMFSGHVRVEKPVAYSGEPGADGDVSVTESIAITFNARKGSVSIDGLIAEANRVLGIWKRDLYLNQGLVPPVSATFDEV